MTASICDCVFTLSRAERAPSRLTVPNTLTSTTGLVYAVGQPLATPVTPADSQKDRRIAGGGVLAIERTRGLLKPLDLVALLLVIVGALNWAVVGLFDLDLVAAITGSEFG